MMWDSVCGFRIAIRRYDYTGPPFSSARHRNHDNVPKENPIVKPSLIDMAMVRAAHILQKVLLV